MPEDEGCPGNFQKIALRPGVAPVPRRAALEVKEEE